MSQPSRPARWPRSNATGRRDIPPVSHYADLACRPDDNHLFYPEDSPYTDGPTAAKRLCSRCPRADACLQWALETDQEYGIWGGKTPWERSRIKKGGRQNKKPSHPVTHPRMI